METVKCEYQATSADFPEVFSSGRRVDGETLRGWEILGDADWWVEEGNLVSRGGGKGYLWRRLASPWFELTGQMMARHLRNPFWR